MNFQENNISHWNYLTATLRWRLSSLATQSETLETSSTWPFFTTWFGLHAWRHLTPLQYCRIQNNQHYEIILENKAVNGTAWSTLKKKHLECFRCLHFTFTSKRRKYTPVDFTKIMNPSSCSQGKANCWAPDYLNSMVQTTDSVCAVMLNISLVCSSTPAATGRRLISRTDERPLWVPRSLAVTSLRHNSWTNKRQQPTALSLDPRQLPTRDPVPRRDGHA